MTNSENSSAPRIDKDDSKDVARWTKEFAVTDEQLLEALARVGDKAPDVELYLKGSRSSTNSDTTDKAEKPK